MIVGIGTDIVNIKRMENSLRKNGLSFKNRIFSKLPSENKFIA